MRRALGILGVVGIAAAGYAWWHYYGSEADATPAQPLRPTPVVKTVRAATHCLPVYVRGIGRVDPFNQVQIKSRVDGQIDRVLFTEGDEVKAGQPLVEIDPRPYAAAVAQAEAQLARDQAQLQAARADLDRSNTLVQKGFATHQTVDQQSSLVGQYSAAIKADQAALDNAKLNLSFATIRAPIAGRIGKRLVDAGNIIHAADNTVLAEIVQIHPISVVLTVPQDALPDIQVHQKDGHLKVEARGADDQKLIGMGELTLIGNTIDQLTGTIELKASFDNADDKLWPGQFVTARVITAMRNNAVAVPMAAIEPGPAGKFVYVVDEKSAVQARNVKLGAPAHGLAVVEMGLQPGDAVVLDQQDQLKPGMNVSPQEQPVEPTVCEAADKVQHS
jgi:multidrug efflux system membrane fusion protein